MQLAAAAAAGLARFGIGFLLACLKWGLFCVAISHVERDVSGRRQEDRLEHNQAQASPDEDEQEEPLALRHGCGQLEGALLVSEGLLMMTC